MKTKLQIKTVEGHLTPTVLKSGFKAIEDWSFHTQPGVVVLNEKAVKAVQFFGITIQDAMAEVLLNEEGKVTVSCRLLTP